MAQSYRIVSVTIDGFRGINKRLQLDFDSKSVLISGRNGLGKTSILQAIEWCLLGQCGYMNLREFKMEDAIVNLFHTDRKAVVVVKLDGKNIIEARRERTMGKSTTGKSRLTLTIGKEIIEGDEAQEKLLDLLGTNVEQFYATAYLHQEAIRDFISSDAADRNRVIDELLGLYVLRELSEALSVKDVEKEVKACENEMHRIETTTIDALALAKKKLTDYMTELKKKGYTEESLSPQHLVKLSKEIASELLQSSDLMRAEVKKVEVPEPELSKLETAFSKLNDNLNELDKQRFGVYRKAEQRRSKLELLREGYTEALEDLQKLGKVDRKKSEEDRADLNEKSERLEQEQDKKQETLQYLLEKKSTVKGLVAESQRWHDRVEEIKKRGTEAELRREIEKTDRAIAELDREKQRVSSHSQMLRLSLDYISKVKPEDCPVCERPIQHTQVEKALRQRISKAEDILLTRIERETKKLDGQKKKAKECLDQLTELGEKLEGTESELEEEARGIQKKIGLKPKRPIDGFVEEHINDMKKSLAELRTKIDEQKKKSEGISSTLKELDRVENNVMKCEGQIQEMIESKEKGEKLLGTLREREKESEDEIGRLEELNQKFTSVRDKLHDFKAILDYVTERERIAKVEKELPEAKEKIAELEEKSTKLKELSMAMFDVQQAINTEKEGLLNTTLASIQDELNSCYSKMSGHPYFVHLQVAPEEEREGYVYRLVAYDKDKTHSTYVQTRFSNSQTNVVALSLSLAMSSTILSRVGFLILDDPSQSLDSAHKTSVASVLQEYSKEKQIIVATQDEEFTKAVSGILGGKACIFEDWDTEGPKLRMTAL